MVLLLLKYYPLELFMKRWEFHPGFRFLQYDLNPNAAGG